MSHIFTEAKLEQAIIELLGQHANNAGQTCYPHYLGITIPRKNNSEVLIVDDLRQYLAKQYQADGITDGEITRIVQQLQSLLRVISTKATKPSAIGSVTAFYSSVKIATKKTYISNLLILKPCPTN